MPFTWRINITKNPKKGKPAIFTFEETPEVEVGDAVFWSNQDKVAHWPALVEQDDAFMPNQIAPKSTSPIFTPNVTGTITYICALHKDEGGVIDVAAAPPAPTPPPAPPPASTTGKQGKQ
jgi:plastocyanin